MVFEASGFLGPYRALEFLGIFCRIRLRVECRMLSVELGIPTDSPSSFRM